MVGAATAGMGTEALYEDPGRRQIAFDIYRPHDAVRRRRAPDPVADGCEDAVCVQAVLEQWWIPRGSSRKSSAC